MNDKSTLRNTEIAVLLKLEENQICETVSYPKNTYWEVIPVEAHSQH
jgi:hypothetical protein